MLCASIYNIVFSKQILNDLLLAVISGKVISLIDPRLRHFSWLIRVHKRMKDIVNTSHPQTIHLHSSNYFEPAFLFYFFPLRPKLDRNLSDA